MVWVSQGVGWRDVELWAVWPWGSRKATDAGGRGVVESWARCGGRRRAEGCRLTWRFAEEKESGEWCEGVRQGPAFMLLCECLRAWREPLRMAALCSELLLHARAWSVMRWGVFAFSLHSPFISLCCGFSPVTLSAVF